MGYGCLTVTRWNVFIGLSWHEALFWWPMPPPGAYVPQKYWPHLSFGLVSGTHLFSFWSDQGKREIQLDGVHWMGRGSDASLVVPHVDVVQGWNPLLPWTILFGSSISVWGTSGVTIACDNPIFGETACDLACSPFKTVPFSIHLACNSPVSLPLDFTVVWGTAKAGFTWADFVACLVDIAIEIAMDILMKFGGQIAGKMWKGAKAAGKGVLKGAKMVGKGAANLAQPFVEADRLVEFAAAMVAEQAGGRRAHARNAQIVGEHIAFRDRPEAFRPDGEDRRWIGKADEGRLARLADLRRIGSRSPTRH